MGEKESLISRDFQLERLEAEGKPVRQEKAETEQELKQAIENEVNKQQAEKPKRIPVLSVKNAETWARTQRKRIDKFLFRDWIYPLKK